MIRSADKVEFVFARKDQTNSSSSASCSKALRVPGQSYQMEIAREAKYKDLPWGFRWEEGPYEDGTLVISALIAGSMLDKYNLKCRALGQASSVVCLGDKLVEAAHQKYETNTQNIKQE